MQQQQHRNSCITTSTTNTNSSSITITTALQHQRQHHHQHPHRHRHQHGIDTDFGILTLDIEFDVRGSLRGPTDRPFGRVRHRVRMIDHPRSRAARSRKREAPSSSLPWSSRYLQWRRRVPPAIVLAAPVRVGALSGTFLEPNLHRGRPSAWRMGRARRKRSCTPKRAAPSSLA